MASPKVSKEDQVQALFTKLAPLIKGQQHKKAVRTIDSSELSYVCWQVQQSSCVFTQLFIWPAVLKLQPGDQDAVKCKVAVLLEGSSFQEALDYIHALPANSFQFEQVAVFFEIGVQDCQWHIMTVLYG